MFNGGNLHHQGLGGQDMSMLTLYSEMWGDGVSGNYYDFSFRNYYLNKVIILVSDAFSSCKFIEKDLKTGELVEDPNKRLITNLLTNPNENQTYIEFFREYIRNLYACGYVYLLPYHENRAYRNFIDKGAKLFCLQSDSINFGNKSVSHFENNITFEYRQNGFHKRYNYAETIPFYDISQDPINKFKGVSRLKSIENEVTQINLSNKAIINQLRLSGNIIVTPSGGDKNEFSEGLNRTTNIYQGTTQKEDIENKLNISGLFTGKSLTVTGTPLKAINLAESIKDYDFNTKFKQEAGRIILNLYGIPRKLQNIITTAELKSDKEGEDIDLYEKIVLPLAQNFAKSINTTYSPITGTEIELDYSHLSVFTEKTKNERIIKNEQNSKRVDYLLKLLDKGLIDDKKTLEILENEKII